MNRLNSLISKYKSGPTKSKEEAERMAFETGFLAARKMCAIMGKIAQLEGKDIQAEILKVGTEQVERTPYPKLVEDIE